MLNNALVNAKDGLEKDPFVGTVNVEQQLKPGSFLRIYCWWRYGTMVCHVIGLY